MATIERNKEMKRTTHRDEKRERDKEGEETEYGRNRATCFTCFLLEGLCEEFNDDVIKVSAPNAPVAHCGEHPHVLLDEIDYRHTVALGEGRGR
jgi:hypothetical protein